MRVPWRDLVQTALTISLLAAASALHAETWPLELKRFESHDPSRGYSSQMDYIYRATSPQHFYMQFRPDPKKKGRINGLEQHEAAFKKIVKKEPKYHSKRPFKGVAKLGTQEFAFALDVAPAPDKPKEPLQTKGDTKPKAKSEDAKSKEESKEKQPPKKEAIDVPMYDRLYFDVNHNGDLTDDKVLEGKIQKYPQPEGRMFARIGFPRLDVTIDADGTSMASSIHFSGDVNSSPDWGHVGIRINAGAYREGEITLEGKKRKVVLIDFNSNGRFDDEMHVATIHHSADDQGQLYPQAGDMLLIDPKESKIGYDSPYDVTSSDYRYNVSKLVCIDGRYYDLKITPAGDRLTLNASKVATGNVTNPNNGFRALIHGKAGVLKIGGDKDVPIPVPVGEWTLLSYVITVHESPKPAEPAKKDAEKKPNKEESALKLLQETAKAFMSSSAPLLHPARPLWSMVSARATVNSKPIAVVEGKTVELPFGPPYRPVVMAEDYGNPNQQQLEMSLIGSAGEICSNLMTYRGRPPKPEFTITDPKGKVVEQGSFEYG